MNKQELKLYLKWKVAKNTVPYGKKSVKKVGNIMRHSGFGFNKDEEV